MARKTKQEKSELEQAIETLGSIRSLGEKGRIELLVLTQWKLNNGDAMEYFGAWLSEVCDAIGVEQPDLETTNPFASGDTTTTTRKNSGKT